MGVTLPIGSVSLLKLLPLREGPWHYEVEQRPQLLQRVLRERERKLITANYRLITANYRGIPT